MRLPSKYDDFWEHVAIREPDVCWPWLAKFNHDGYGQFSERAVPGPKGQRTIRAHMRAYELTKGPVSGRTVRHTCDNPPCCNPRHLLAGTQRDNILDAVQKGRHRSWAQRLTRTDAQEIRRLRSMGVARSIVAAQYHIDPTTVSHITTGRRHSRHLCETVAVRLEAIDVRS